ncbi:MAG TPA: hypothetical protein PLO53_14825, partial [Candidatus Hydrogenedentes bacterium]|nr:hypothetical protein [Candidatus Hydrogenedentota bacterium]
LRLTQGAGFNISAGSPQPGSAGGAGGPGRPQGSTGSTAADGGPGGSAGDPLLGGVLPDWLLDLITGGGAGASLTTISAFAAGAKGGKGGQGGASAAGGPGGSGGAGGNGAPGMVKLHGSVVLVEQAGAQTPTVIAANAASAAPEHNGKFTIISNMTPAAVAANQPQFSNPNVVKGSATHDAVLKAFNSYSLTPSPLIPNLVGGPAPNGWCKENYWNQAEVEAATPAGQIGDLVWWVVPSVFDGFDQLVIKNTGTTILQEVTVKINANNRRLIRGAGYDNGFLRAGQSWTTTVPTGSMVTVNFDGEGAGADGSIYESDGHLGDLTVSGGTITIDTGTYGGAPGTMTVGSNTYQARTDVRYETGQEVAVFEFENVSVSGASVT